MKPDITAFGLGSLACILGAIALWACFGGISWAWIGRAAPVTLVVLGIVMLILSLKKNTRT
ncbi:MAG: hypothetical protein VB080_02090 [Propionicimonas sp.]|uniref:hypothetical protein n=1 Tax=Propionicimonas sp. TaxID=1955623 RepID=UPI002B1EDFF5|nr:hypothetical protein [Propionicimonas sp.]MEA4943207.1 hypothetical protein [Propionicimonas sp.]MEA5055408.1 hypothetical protein [Propionicimonas sp.]MEA5119568.1 hypothetical protein [Propionicimonas sp.]